MSNDYLDIQWVQNQNWVRRTERNTHSSSTLINHAKENHRFHKYQKNDLNIGLHHFGYTFV